MTAEEKLAANIKARVLKSLGLNEPSTPRQEEVIDSYIFAVIEVKRKRAILAKIPERNDRTADYLHAQIRQYCKDADRLADILGLPMSMPDGQGESGTKPHLKNFFGKGKAKVLKFDKSKKLNSKQKAKEESINTEELIGQLPNLSKKPSVDELRIGLLSRLGPCVDCGEADITKLEPDHIHGSTWEVSKYGARQRIEKYLEDEARGILQSKCRSCNARDGAKRLQGKARWKNKIPLKAHDKKSNKKKSQKLSKKKFPKATGTCRPGGDLARPSGAFPPEFWTKKNQKSPDPGDFLSRMRKQA